MMAIEAVALFIGYCIGAGTFAVGMVTGRMFSREQLDAYKRREKQLVHTIMEQEQELARREPVDFPADEL